MVKVKVLLTNRWAEFIAPYPEQLKDIFSYVKPGSFFNPWVRMGKVDGRYHFLKYDRVPAGLFLALKDSIENEWEVKFIVKYDRKKLKFEEWDKAQESDRYYQNECVLAMRRHSRVGGIILMATGVGKTYVAGKFFQGMHGTGVFIVDELGLLQQAREEISRVLGEAVGYVGNMKFLPSRITVATVQTLQRHKRDPKFMPWYKSLKAVIIDEVHEMLGKRNHDIVANIMPRACYGLTATLQLRKKPIRMKAMALTGPVIYKFPYSAGVKEKYLAPSIAISLRIKRSGHKHLDKWEEYDKLIAKSKSYNEILEKLIRYAIKRNHSVLQLVQRPKHVRVLSKRLNYIPHRTAYGGIKVRDRNLAKQELESRSIRLVVANMVFKKGTNIKRVDLIIDAAGLPNYDDTQQKLGRGARLCKGKKGLIYIDIGYENHEGVTKEDYDYNKYAKGTKIRYKALKALNVPVYKMYWNGSAKQVIRFAERKLKQHLKKFKSDE